MAIIYRRVAYLFFPMALGVLAPTAFAQEHWVATWAASPQIQVQRPPVSPLPGPPGTSQPPASASSVPSGTSQPPAPALPPPQIVLQDATIRMIAHTSIGGRRVRVQFTNAFSAVPLQIAAAHLAVRDKDSAIVPATDRQLTFGGSTGIKIPAGAEVISDAVDVDVPKLGDVAVSVYIPGQVTDPTVHFLGLHTTYISQPGDSTGALSIADGKTSNSYYFLSAIHVLAPAESGVIVAFGDSITDGATSTPNTDSAWPAQLAKRLLDNKATAKIAVVDEGISGNCVLGDCAGIPALARFDRDVLAQPGVRWLIVLEGINDIGIGSIRPSMATSAEALIAGHRQLIERAHEHGIKVIGATLTPFDGARYFSDAGEEMRTALNDWIRSGKGYDAYIDFDKTTRDPENPKQILPAYNIRDHLHPNDAGYKAMADAIDLSLFTAGRRGH